MTSHLLRCAAAIIAALGIGGCTSSHTPEAVPPFDCGECGTGSTCVRGVCLDDCGGDPSVFDTDLAEDLSPVANLCVDLPDGPIAAHARDAATFTLVQASAATTGTATRLTVDRHLASLLTGGLTRAEPSRAAG